MSRQVIFDPEPVLATLKDFQRDTVNYVFRRLYEDADRTRRFLVADEVGLGKTLVARGLIARVIARLQQNGVKRIDILYICSNADIARQNIDKLRVTGAPDFPPPSRITLLPRRLQDLNRGNVNLISFTPGTSFDMRSGMGMGEERALLHCLLREAWGLTDAGTRKALQGYMNPDNFNALIKKIKSSEVDAGLKVQFFQRLAQHPELRQQFDRTRDRYRVVRNQRNVEVDERLERADIVARLRLLLAQSCLQALEPDLIILDEFQRFKNLLDTNNEAGQLAHDLFNYADAHSEARVVLLSATPYKMYTLQGEESDDHYRDFLQTVRFLLPDPAQSEGFERLLKAYRHEIFHLDANDSNRLSQIKDDIERTLRKVMTRTERLATSPERNGMLRSVNGGHMEIKPAELRAYCAYQEIADILGQDNTLEYWKSAPYLLNFMEGYKLKEAFRKGCADGALASALADTLANASSLLPRNAIARYAALDPMNARLRHLRSQLDAADAYHLLWLPPALPYYTLAGPFATEEARRFTKRLIFSSWRVVPKVIATLVSYEAERRLITEFEPAAENTPEARKKRRPLLRWTRDGSRPGAMSLLTLLYPCARLAEIGDPLALAIEQPNGLREPGHYLALLAERIKRDLRTAGLKGSAGGEEDASWYWAAPLLLDNHFGPEVARDWWQQPNLGERWNQARDTEDVPDDATAFSAHLDEARCCLSGAKKLGRQPDDLPEVLAAIALGAPGVVALRGLLRAAGATRERINVAVLNEAASVAWGFRSLFNTPEATALIRHLELSATPREPRRKTLLERILRSDTRETAYWQKVLEYCIAGCLQAVVDEYAHLLVDGSNLREVNLEEVAKGVGHQLSETLALRTASLQVDDVSVKGASVEIKPDLRMRAHFAVRFGDETQDEENQDVLRKAQVREAFNSPFWPFVLATTSVGQEGLDFHRYCHAVVHWNLPANPVDLEQREGRVHRYKGHAVRKNLALRYGLEELRDAAADPWEALFAAGKRDRATDANDLVPFWVFPPTDPVLGAFIERHVPAMALSRDTLRAEQLKRALALYRLVFGQARQEELVAHLNRHVPEEKIAEVAARLQINLEPPRAATAD